MRTRQLNTGSETITIKAEISNGVLKAVVDGETLEGPFIRTAKGAGLWRIGEKAYRIVASEQDGKIWAAVNGRVYTFEDTRAKDETGASEGGGNSISAPMPGKVIKVLVKTGDKVEESQPVVIVEAMKMEHILRAPKAGIISRLACEEGQQVDPGVPLVEIEEPEES